MSTSIEQIGAGVISERNELHATGDKDCTYAGIMRMCADAGVVFPLADDLDAEREALERSDTWPDEQGAPISAAVEAATNRYGFAGHEVADLHKALGTVGLTLVVQGTNSRLPLRCRAYATFTGGHAGTVRVNRDGGLTWLDPGRAMGYPGDRITEAEVLHFAWGAQFARQARAGEAVPKGDPMITVPAAVTINSSHTLTLPAGTVLYQTPGGAVVKTYDAPHTRPYMGDAGGGWKAIAIDVPSSVAFVKTTIAPVARPPVVDPDAATIAAFTKQVAAAETSLAAAQRKIAAAKTASASITAANASLTAALG